MNEFIQNKTNNFSDFYIYKNQAQNIILLGESHEDSAQSDNIIDIYSVSKMAKQQQPIVINECYEHLEIPVEFTPQPGEIINVPDDYEPRFDTVSHNEAYDVQNEGGITQLDYVERLPHIGINYRLVLLIQEIFNQYVQNLYTNGTIVAVDEYLNSFTGDAVFEFIMGIRRAITTFDSEACSIIDQNTQDLNEEIIQLSFIEQSYKSNRGEPYNAHFHTLHFLIDFINRFGLSDQQKHNITTFFNSNEQQANYISQMDSFFSIDNTNDGNIYNIDGTLDEIDFNVDVLFSYVVDFIAICYLERCLTNVGPDLIFAFGAIHINTIKEYLDYIGYNCTYDSNVIHDHTTYNIIENLYGQPFMNQLERAGLIFPQLEEDDGFDKKYLKYKKKYLELRKKINKK